MMNNDCFTQVFTKDLHVALTGQCPFPTTVAGEHCQMRPEQHLLTLLAIWENL